MWPKYMVEWYLISIQDLYIFVLLWCAGGVQQSSVKEPQRWEGVVGDRPSRARCLPSVEVCCSLLPSCPMEVRARNEEEKRGRREGGESVSWVAMNNYVHVKVGTLPSSSSFLSLLVFFFLVPPLCSLFSGPSFPPHLTLSLPLHQATL